MLVFGLYALATRREWFDRVGYTADRDNDPL
jgi:hypothetical protein